MKTLAMNEIMPHLYPQFETLTLTLEHGPSLAKVYPLLCERAQTLKDVALTARYFYTEDYPKDEKAFAKHITDTTRPALMALHEKFSTLKDFTAANIHEQIQAVSTELDLPMGKVGMPLRVALTGGGQSPSIDITAELIGQSRCLARIAGALNDN